MDIVNQMEQTHRAKNEDYTSGNNPMENFERAAIISSWFQRPEDKVFATLIGIKLARLASLLVDNKVPNNESVEDTHLDMTNYSALWAVNNRLKK